jgi:hypothetical protein
MHRQHGPQRAAPWQDDVEPQAPVPCRTAYDGACRKRCTAPRTIRTRRGARWPARGTTTARAFGSRASSRAVSSGGASRSRPPCTSSTGVCTCRSSAANRSGRASRARQSGADEPRRQLSPQPAQVPCLPESRQVLQQADPLRTVTYRAAEQHRPPDPVRMPDEQALGHDRSERQCEQVDAVPPCGVEHACRVVGVAVHRGGDRAGARTPTPRGSTLNRRPNRDGMSGAQQIVPRLSPGRSSRGRPTPASCHARRAPSGARNGRHDRVLPAAGGGDRGARERRRAAQGRHGPRGHPHADSLGGGTCRPGAAPDSARLRSACTRPVASTKDPAWRRSTHAAERSPRKVSRRP